MHLRPTETSRKRENWSRTALELPQGPWLHVSRVWQRRQRETQISKTREHEHGYQDRHQNHRNAKAATKATTTKAAKKNATVASLPPRIETSGQEDEPDRSCGCGPGQNERTDELQSDGRMRCRSKACGQAQAARHPTPRSTLRSFARSIPRPKTRGSKRWIAAVRPERQEVTDAFSLPTKTHTRPPARSCVASGPAAQLASERQQAFGTVARSHRCDSAIRCALVERLHNADRVKLAHAISLNR